MLLSHLVCVAPTVRIVEFEGGHVCGCAVQELQDLFTWEFGLPGVSLEISHDTVKLGCLYGFSYRVGMLFDRVGTQPTPLSRVSQSFQTENPSTCKFYQLGLHLLQLILKLDSLYSLSVL